MTMRRTGYLLLFLFAMPAAMPVRAQEAQPYAEKIFDRMFNALDEVKTLRYTLYSKERFGTNYIEAHALVKVNVSPFKVYYKDLDRGVEALWIDGVHDNEALVNPNGFPYMDLRLDPNGKLMHKDAHQTIERLGYGYIRKTLYYSIHQFPDAFQKYIRYTGDTMYDGAECYKVVLDISNFHYYTALVEDKGETLNSFADKFYLNNYLVLTANHLSSYEEPLTVGQILTIPSAYAKTTYIFIRKDNNLPVYFEIYDDKGLFENYGFTNVQVNTPMPDEEFSENYRDYHF